MRHLLIICLASLLTHAASGQFTQKDFAPLHQLQGSWKMQTRQGWLFEQWKLADDSTMESQSFTVNGADTVLQETAILSLKNGMITYSPTVSNHNDGLPVTFTLAVLHNGDYAFENKEHDFPQRINYQLKGNRLTVTISGNTASGFREIPYHFVRE